MSAWWKRGICALLVAGMALTACACKGGGSASGGGAADIQPMEGETPEKLDGYEFKVVDLHDTRWNRENSGTPYYDAWQQVLDEVETLYDCKISLETASPDELFTRMQPEVMAGGEYANIVCTTQWAYGRLIGGDLVMDLNELEVNWDNPWWNQSIRQISTVQGKTYAANGSFIFDASSTYMLYYNEDIWKELKLPDPYEIVNSGKWTMDKFMEYAKMANRDDDHSGAMDSESDRWGVATPDGDFCRALFMGMGGSYFSTNDQGRVVLACNNNRSYDIVEKMQKMVKQDKSICTLTGSEWTKVLSLFTSGHALFLGNSPGVQDLKDCEFDWGVMPMPKLNEEQEEYTSCVDHNSVVFGVPRTNTHRHETSVLLEALGRHAQLLEDIYWPDYDTTYWRHPEQDSQIIADYVAHHGRYDIGNIMKNCTATFGTPDSVVFSCVFGGGSDYASTMQAAEDAINYTINEFFNYEDTTETDAA